MSGAARRIAWRAASCALGIGLGYVLSCARPARADVVAVSDVQGLRRASADAKPGTRIRIEPGDYPGGVRLDGLRGAPDRPIVLEARDPTNPPRFRGGASGLHLVDPVHVEVRGLRFEAQTGNGLNIDDGGTPETPAGPIVLADLVVRDVGPTGNCDGIKLSGVAAFRIERCVVERWGDGGSAIDLVGCRDGEILDGRFVHAPGASRGSGVQVKGGSRDVAIRRNRFEHAGARAINAGGSTGLAWFRPPLATWEGVRFEAREILIEGNTFLGGDCAVAFVGVDGATFRFNTIVRPARWALRILQETTEEGFVPSRAGVITDNLFAFESATWSAGGVNVGPNTDPASFRFERNAWTCVDRPERSRAMVRLPTEERAGRYGLDPAFRDAPRGDFRPAATSPLRDVGAHALAR